LFPEIFTISNVSDGAAEPRNSRCSVFVPNLVRVECPSITLGKPEDRIVFAAEEFLAMRPPGVFPDDLVLKKLSPKDFV
jgi:hypothetical protein